MPHCSNEGCRSLQIPLPSPETNIVYSSRGIIISLSNHMREKVFPRRLPVMSSEALTLIRCLLETQCVDHKQEQGFQALMVLIVFVVFIARNRAHARRRLAPVVQPSFLAIAGGTFADLIGFTVILEVLLRLESKGVLNTTSLVPQVLLGFSILSIAILAILIVDKRNERSRYLFTKRDLLPLLLLIFVTILALVNKSVQQDQSPFVLMGVSFILTLLVDATLRNVPQQPARRSTRHKQ